MASLKYTNDYLSFNRKERVIALSLAVIISAVFLFPKFIKSNTLTNEKLIENKKPEMVKTIESNKSNEANVDELAFFKETKYTKNTTNNYTQTQTPVYFNFDPNLATEEQFKQLGLRSKTINTIIHYRQKGGKFRKPSDMQKIYGLKMSEFNGLAPYINIKDEKSNENVSSKINYSTTQNVPQKYAPVYTPKEHIKKIKVIDINLADTSAFIALPFIGSKLANRIINFRQKLGGFYSINQIAETYGIGDTVFQKIKPYLEVNNAVLRKININTATGDELKMHPYIKWALAKFILDYRKKHVAFKSIQEINNIPEVLPTANKIMPYLTVQ